MSVTSNQGDVTFMGKGAQHLSPTAVLKDLGFFGPGHLEADPVDADGQLSPPGPAVMPASYDSANT